MENTLITQYRDKLFYETSSQMLTIGRNLRKTHPDGTFLSRPCGKDCQTGGRASKSVAKHVKSQTRIAPPIKTAPRHRENIFLARLPPNWQGHIGIKAYFCAIYL